EHSLGVMELATQAFDLLALRYPERLENELKQIPELGDRTMAKARQIVRLMALLHDVGHPAFSHAAETTIPGGDHEKLSIHIIANVLGPEVADGFFEGATSLLVRLMERSPELTFLREFVASQMDMDRTDYLRRDSLHCGVDYGVFDSRRLIDSLVAIENPDSGRLQLAIHRGGEHTFEALILARYQMNTQVYLHRIRRIYDYYLTEYMKLWGAEHHRTFDDVLKHDDSSVLMQIRRDAEDDNERSKWARRIVQRDHHRRVLETGDYADEQRLRRMRRLHRQLKEEYPNVDFYLDDAAHDIHKLTIPGEQDPQRVEDLYIVEKDGKLKLLSEDSAIIGKIPKRVRTVRIFADATGEALQAIRTKARALEAHTA
ncbi:MAG: HD domain-containing protein, partial [Planctomycetes bacterium]|nr:HD domain-containing protein [Planctomycetota bacterium]